MTVNNHFTAYELIASDIREKIEENIFKPEQRLPSVLELCSEYNASDSTIRDGSSATRCLARRL